MIDPRSMYGFTGKFHDFVSSSEAHQDTFVYLTFPPNYVGTFLDIGCNDPHWNNNSYALEQRGWTGLLMDYDEQFIDQCKAIRNNPVMYANATTICWTEVINTYSLPSMMDYLSLDIDHIVEDNTVVKVLNNLLPVISFKVMTIEHDCYWTGEKYKQDIRDVVQGFGYTLKYADIGYKMPYEDWWIK